MIYILTLIIHNDNILIHYIRSAYINNGISRERRALELYNAINNTEYDNPDDVEMVTLDGGI